jgi:hypothetical protein
MTGTGDARGTVPVRKGGSGSDGERSVSHAVLKLFVNGGGDRNREKPGRIYGGNGKGLVGSFIFVDGVTAEQKNRRGVSTVRAEEGPENRSFSADEAGPDTACEERWVCAEDSAPSYAVDLHHGRQRNRRDAGAAPDLGEEATEEVWLGNEGRWCVLQRKCPKHLCSHRLK